MSTFNKLEQLGIILEVLDKDSVRDAIFDYAKSDESERSKMQTKVGVIANIEACKILKDKGWSNTKIAEILDIPESRVREYVS